MAASSTDQELTGQVAPDVLGSPISEVMQLETDQAQTGQDVDAAAEDPMDLVEEKMEEVVVVTREDPAAKKVEVKWKWWRPIKVQKASNARRRLKRQLERREKSEQKARAKKMVEVEVEPTSGEDEVEEDRPTKEPPGEGGRARGHTLGGTTKVLESDQVCGTTTGHAQG